MSNKQVRTGFKNKIKQVLPHKILAELYLNYIMSYLLVCSYSNCHGILIVHGIGVYILFFIITL